MFVRAISDKNFFTDSVHINVTTYPRPPPLEFQLSYVYRLVAYWKKPQGVEKCQLKFTVFKPDIDWNAGNINNGKTISSRCENRFSIGNIEPETSYAFALLLTYNDSSEATLWDTKQYFYTPKQAWDYNYLLIIPTSSAIILVICFIGIPNQGWEM